MQNTKQIALIILDGWGYREETTHNAIAEAKTPNFDRLWNEYPHTLLEASGLAVGLPEGQMGNSEIGHTTIGAGLTMDTDLVKIHKAIADEKYHETDAFKQLFDHVKKYNSRIHTIGLLSDGGVHSHQEHLFAFLKAAHGAGLKKDQVVLHVFTDGRDTLPRTASKYLETLEEKLEHIGVGVFGGVGGRYFGMDRAGNWDRIKIVEDALFECKGKEWNLALKTPSQYMEEQYIKDPSGKIDEYMEHYICKGAAGETYPVTQNDAVFFFNFRADRGRQLTQKILERKDALNLLYVTMTPYGDEIDTIIAFPPVKIETSLAKELSKNNLRQVHISESEKFPHVTFFLNAQSDVVHKNERHVKVESRTDIKTHDEAPEMMAKEIVDEAIKALDDGTNFVIVNFPNADVVGHTGNIPAIHTAVEAVDRECGRLVDAILARGGTAFVTADHGNAEINVDIVSGEKHTAHTLSPVPAIITDKNLTLNVGGTLADITPTILKLFGIAQPSSMTGKSLV